MDTDDKALVRQCLEGNKESFEIIVEKYYKTVFRLAFRILHNNDDAEEITQTVFIKAYENLEKYKDKYKFFSWLYRIAVNETLNFSKKQSYTEKLNENYFTEEENPDRIYEKSEMGDNIQIALMELDILYRVPVVLRHFLDYSYKELSELLDIPEKTVKSRLFTGRQLLKDILIKSKVLQK